MSFLLLHLSSSISHPFVLPSLITLVILVVLVAIVLMALSRHKKSGTGRIQLLGAEAYVESQLNPEGAVLIQGELWRARSEDGTSIAAQERVEVVAVEGHLLLVRRYV
jgi:membrane-bound serine protease (ClpP class)